MVGERKMRERERGRERVRKRQREIEKGETEGKKERERDDDDGEAKQNKKKSMGLTRRPGNTRKSPSACSLFLCFTGAAGAPSVKTGCGSGTACWRICAVLVSGGVGG